MIGTSLAILAALATAGCSEHGSGDDGVATYEPYGEGSDAALLEGRLELAPGCVYVVDPQFDQRHVPVFPADEVQREGDVLTYGDVTFEDGDEISLGGGAAGGTWAPEADGHSVPDECDLTVGAFIVGQDLGPG